MKIRSNKGKQQLTKTWTGLMWHKIPISLVNLRPFNVKSYVEKRQFIFHTIVSTNINFIWTIWVSEHNSNHLMNTLVLVLGKCHELQKKF